MGPKGATVGSQGQPGGRAQSFLRLCPEDPLLPESPSLLPCGCHQPHLSWYCSARLQKVLAGGIRGLLPREPGTTAPWLC